MTGQWLDNAECTGAAPWPSGWQETNCEAAEVVGSERQNLDGVGVGSAQPLTSSVTVGK